MEGPLYTCVCCITSVCGMYVMLSDVIQQHNYIYIYHDDVKLQRCRWLYIGHIHSR